MTQAYQDAANTIARLSPENAELKERLEKAGGEILGSYLENAELKERYEKEKWYREKEHLSPQEPQRNDLERERTIEEIIQFIKNEPIHSWVPGILAERIRAKFGSSK